MVGWFGGCRWFGGWAAVVGLVWLVALVGGCVIGCLLWWVCGWLVGLVGVVGLVGGWSSVVGWFGVCVVGWLVW